jgi:hypothetical protein
MEWLMPFILKIAKGRSTHGVFDFGIFDLQQTALLRTGATALTAEVISRESQ